MSAIKQPGRKKIRVFLDVIERLDRFEATQRVIRGQGADINGPLPVPEVVEVLGWLRELSKPSHRHTDAKQPQGREP